MSEIKVFDLENQERDFAYAEAKYGVVFRRAKVAQGQKVYRLVELREKAGNVALITKVMGEAGQPLDQVDVAFYWPDAPPNEANEIYPHDWHANFVHGPTNANGDVGPAMGTGAYHGEGEGGPHAVWVRDPNIPSDICEKLGMLAGTFHDHLDQKFQLTIEGGQEPMPQEGKFVEDTSRRRFDRTEGTNHIAINCLETSAKNFYDTRADLRCGTWEDPNPILPQSLYHYNIYIGDYVPSPGETNRIYRVAIRHAGTEEVMSDWMEFKFETGVKGIHHAYLEWKTEPGPEPEPEPEPSTELMEVLNKMEAHLAKIADSRLFNL